MEWQQALLEIIELVKSAAPHLWRVARRQVYANIALSGIWALFVIALSGVLWWLRGICNEFDEEAREEAKEEWSSRYDGGWKATATACAILSGVFVPIAIAIITGIVMRLINPDYYAIQVLLDLAK